MIKNKNKLENALKTVKKSSTSAVSFDEAFLNEVMTEYNKYNKDEIDYLSILLIIKEKLNIDEDDIGVHVRNNPPLYNLLMAESIEKNRMTKRFEKVKEAAFYY